MWILATVIPRRENLQIISVQQLEKDAILVCYSSKIDHGVIIFRITFDIILMKQN